MNEEERKQYMKEYNNRESTKLKKKEWVKNNTKKTSKQQNDWRRKNLNYNKEWCEDNKDKKTESNKKASKNYIKNNPEKYKIRYKLMCEIKKRNIIHPSKLNCYICQIQAEEYHHPDYLKPKEIVAVCRKCHCKIHGRIYHGEESSISSQANLQEKEK